MDFIVTNMGTTILIRPVTEAAKAWIEENVETEPWQWVGDAFGVDHRPGWGLVDLLEDGGCFEVEVRHPQARQLPDKEPIRSTPRGIDSIDPQPFIDGWHNRDPE